VEALMRVLVAEDEPLLADTIAEGLRRRLMAVDVCYDGDAALERVMVHRYDVVILDRDLPRAASAQGCRRPMRPSRGGRPPGPSGRASARGG